MKIFIFCLVLNAISAKGPITPIINGYEAAPFSYPFMVSIQHEKLHDCGGTLYTEDTVITAAHCKEGDIKDYRVLVHRHDLSKKKRDEEGQHFKIKQFRVHPEYRLNGARNDIAIVKLRRKEKARMGIILDDVGFSDNIGTATTVIGWGMDEKGEYPDKLKETELPILDIDYCVSRYATKGFTINSTQVYCAGFPEGKTDTCSADSGGPAFIMDKGNVVLVGVVSWGLDCARPGFPGFYTRIKTYESWILDNIDK